MRGAAILTTPQCLDVCLAKGMVFGLFRLANLLVWPMFRPKPWPENVLDGSGDLV